MTNEARYVSRLRKGAMDNGWHVKQGKGEKSRNSQDLLSHSIDVLQITYNIYSEFDLETRFSIEDYLSAAFFHDLHKVDEVGGTESMDEHEVNELLRDWAVVDNVLDEFSLREFTDVLRTVHQYSGGYGSGARVRINSDDDLRLLTHVVRLADGIASEEELTNLYRSGYRDNTEALDEINLNPNSTSSTNYVLGYHQLSEVKPALGALIHGSIRDVVSDAGGAPIASRKDATIYLLPERFNSELGDEASQSAIEALNEKSIKTNVPDKIRTDLYGIEDDIETEILTRRDELSKEGGHDDLTDSYRRVVESVTSELQKGDAEDYEVAVAGDELVELEDDMIKTGVPTTQKGYLIGDAVSGLVDTLSSKLEKSRVEILEDLLGDGLDLSEYEEANWRTIQTYLARVAGNYHFQNSDESAEDILDRLEKKSKDLLENGEDENVVRRLSEYISEVLFFSLYDEGEVYLAGGDIPKEIPVNQNYQESCILCGNEGELKYKTSQHLPYSKSYMARGKIGEATADDWDPLLCSTCFIDQALMRSFVNRDDIRIDNMQDTLFFKVFPNRYLGTQQVRELKESLNRDFQGIRTDARNYLEQTDEIEESGSPLGGDTYESRIPLSESIDIGGMQSLVSTENYFLVAAEYYVSSDDNPAKQTTLTWLDAIQRSLLFYRFYNLNVEIESNPEINVEKPYPDEAGVVFRSTPSHISTAFGGSIGFEDIDDWLQGMANMAYSLTFPQYDTDDDLNQIYSDFRSSLYPGSRIFRQAEREWDEKKYGPIEASDNYETYLSICREVDNWKNRTMAEQTTNRINEVVEAFQISVRGNPSTHMIQDPLRKLIDKILDSKYETKEEIINKAAASIYTRVERKWKNPDIYFGYESDKPIQEIIEEGCRIFYKEVYEEMLGGDKIRLANQKEDILDAFYFNIKKRGANGE